MACSGTALLYFTVLLQHILPFIPVHRLFLQPCEVKQICHMTLNLEFLSYETHADSDWKIEQIGTGEFVLGT
jgi:hypothetical protein